MQVFLSMLKKIILFKIVVILLMIAGCGGGSGDSPASNNITVTITVDNIPDFVLYNKGTAPDNFLEYRWGVSFDINNDGVINQGDIMLGIQHFKAPGSIEQIGPVSDFDSGLFVYTTDTETIRVIGITTQISGDSIVLTANKLMHNSLVSVSEVSLVYFETSFYDEARGVLKNDYYPGYKTYVNIPSDGRFIDTPPGDGFFPIIDMVSMEISL